MIAGFTGVFAVGAYWTTRFAIEPDHVVHTTGWIFRRDRRIPLKQIQNVNIRQNVLERVFKVATVDVETAMGHGRDLKLSVLGLADAERFRDELLEAAHIHVSGTHPETGLPIIDPPIATLNSHDLLLGALTENHLQQMIVGMFTIIGPGMGVAIPFIIKQSASGAAVLFSAALGILLVGSWLWGAASYYLKFGGFTVHRNATIIRISYGLLNKAQMAIRPGRIEYLRLTITLPQRWMGRASLHVGTAGSFGEAGVLAPVALFVDLHRAYAGVAEVLPGLDIPQLAWRPFQAVFYAAAATRAVVILLITGLIACGIARIGDGVMTVLPWIMFCFIAAIVLVKNITLFLAKPENAFAITEDALVVRQGYYHQSISAMPIERMENVAINQAIWWKRFGAVRFTVQGMKHRVHVGAMPEEAVDELMAHWKVKIESKENARLYAALAEEAAKEPGETAEAIAQLNQS